VKIPTLVITDGTDESPFGIGVPTLLDVDGKPVEWPTTGEWRVTFGDDQLTTLHVAIPVRIRVVPPEPVE
jgi:hypothetical protein